jgi:hypothetical protein
MFQALALIAHGSTYSTRVEFEQVTDELVRMLHPHFITSQSLFWEVLEVVGDDDVRLAAEGSRQNMAVVGIRKMEIVDQAFVRMLQGSRVLPCSSTHGFVGAALASGPCVAQEQRVSIHGGCGLSNERGKDQ